MIAAEGILTSRGGLVSHAAVVARGMGKPAICGADALQIDLAKKEFHVVVDRESAAWSARSRHRARGRRHLDQRQHRRGRRRRGAGRDARADRVRSASCSAGPTSSAR